MRATVTIWVHLILGVGSEPAWAQLGSRTDSSTLPALGRHRYWLTQAIGRGCAAGPSLVHFNRPLRQKEKRAAPRETHSNDAHIAQFRRVG